jgi:hypothetical protein
MDHINNFQLFSESYLDNIDFDVKFTHNILPDKHQYEFVIDGVKFIVNFFDLNPNLPCSDCGNLMTSIDGSKFNCDQCGRGPISLGTIYEREYYTKKETCPAPINIQRKYKENLGVDPRKIIIAVTKITIDFLGKTNPKSLHIKNLRMGKEQSKLGNNPDREPSKRNKINYYFLKKMLPSKWKILRGPEQIHVYQGEVQKEEIPFYGSYGFGVGMKYLRP